MQDMTSQVTQAQSKKNHKNCSDNVCEQRWMRRWVSLRICHINEINQIERAIIVTETERAVFMIWQTIGALMSSFCFFFSSFSVFDILHLKQDINENNGKR